MARATLVWIGIALAGTSYALAAGQEPSSSAPLSASPQRTLLNRYCVACHNEKLKTAGLMLDKLDVEHPTVDAPVWEKVVRKLRASAMPPAGLPRPDKAAYDSFATYLETALDSAAAAKPNPGRPSIHRLNRAEYTNAIRDLLELEIDGASLLPSDESSFGFDNIGDVLSVSPMLLERYMRAARKISRLAVGDPALRPAFETYDVHKYLMQDDRMSEDLPFGSRGGIAIRHYFPLDAEYVIKIRLQRNFRDYIRGLAEAHQLDIRLDGARIKVFESVGGEHRGKSGAMLSQAGDLGDPKQVDYEFTADAGLEVRTAVTAGPHVVGVAFAKETWSPEGAPSNQLAPPRMAQFEFEDYKGGDPAVASVTIGGPYDAKGLGNTSSRRRIFACHPMKSEPRQKGSGSLANDDESCAKKILSNLARRAYRRTVTEEDLQTLLPFYKAGRSKGSFEAGIETALERILVDPQFLFRIERDPGNAPPDTAYRISDLEMASRLSFFLWSSVPDDQLLDLAARGKLKDSEMLEQQVRRMLADSRSKALVTNFAGQWLNLRSLSALKPDPDAFPDFDVNLRESFQRETELFFESIVREDRSVMDLLNANYTFVNERLARHYGIPNVYGSSFRRVTLSDDRRGGLLGQGSLLTTTSYPNRTAPTIRGKWMLENILGTPPPPPPPNVPSLKDNEETKILTMRQRMEQHRANPACAVCHKVMDPLGFALENFDGLGRWRTAEANNPIDASGALPDGTPVQGPAELRKALLSRRQEFVTTVAEKLLTYALGRGVEYYDNPALRKVLREAAPSGYRWSSLILGIVNSTPFQMRRSAEATTTAGRR